MNPNAPSSKSKLSFKRSIRSDDKERLKNACDTAVSTLQSILQIVNIVAGPSFPPFKAGIDSLLFVIDVIKRTYDNAKDVEDLAGYITELMTIIQNARANGTFSAAVLQRIGRVSFTWKAAADQVQKIASRPAISRFIHYNDDAQLIRSQIQIITWSIQSFTVEALLAIEFALDEHIHFTRHSAIRTEQKMESGFQQLNARFDNKDGYPPHAIFAQFDNKERDYCLKGTRTDILSQIYRWIDLKDTQLTDIETLTITEITRKDPLIFWINGSAGTGKTTIASTVARACRSRNILGASFFCSRDDAECSNPKLIFTTIAHQLGRFCAPFAAEVSRVLKSKPDIGYSSAPYQLEQLIVNPLRTIGKAFPHCVIVVDALDECKDNSTTSIILSSLSRYVSQLGRLKILITSRPEPNVTRMFKSNELSSTTRRIVLHEIEMNVVQHDIDLYLTTQLTRIGKFHGIDKSWPSRKEVLELVLLSFGLFIFAATAARWIEDQNYSDPRYQLETLLHNPGTVAESPTSPIRRLDELYTQVLQNAFPDISLHLAGRLKMILGTIICLRDPLSPLALEHLLNLDVGAVRITLARLHSVILVPEDDTGVIRLLHPSFNDFMTNPTRCLNLKFVVGVKVQHTMLAHACLDVMCNLSRDICHIRDSTKPINELGNLSTRIQQRIPSHLRYACRHWAFHLANGMVSDGLLDFLKKFCSGYLLCWVEVCSLLGELRNSLVALNGAREALANVGKQTSEIMSLLHDCERFTREFFSLLSIFPLQVYRSALLFTPKRTILHETYGRGLLLKIYNATDDTWNECVRTMDGHSGAVTSVAFSPGGQHVMSGSQDKTLRLWDTISGAHLNSFKGHSDYVLSVAFSPDGTRIVSGSEDKTVRLWDVSSGAQVIKLQGHSDCVESVAFSPDGTRIVSGSRDHTIRLWDSESGMKLHVFRGHPDSVTSVAVCPVGMRLASGSRDTTVRLWDIGKGNHVTTLKGHSNAVLSVAFSPSSTRVVSGSEDTTVRLWDALNGTCLSTLKGHSGLVNSVAFSPDGTRILSASHDKTLRLWDTMSGNHLTTLKGHSYSVESAAFSPVGVYIVSGACDKNLRLWEPASEVQTSPTGTTNTTHTKPMSQDETLQIWEAMSGTRLHSLRDRSGPTKSVTLSSDGTRVASVSHDGTLRLWDTVGGTHLHTLKGHSSSVKAVAFSPDSTRVASGSRDNTVRLWDALSGAHLRTLKGHTLSVTAIAFSPDGTRIVSGSEDKTLRLWDVGSGANLHTLKGHSNTIDSVAFSPDGTRVVSGSSNSLRVWDTVIGTHLRTLKGDSHSSSSVARSLESPSQPRSPSTRIRPSSPYVMDSEDEWIISTSSKEKLCWIPVSFRPRCMTSNSTCVVIGTHDGRVIILDLRAMH